MLDEVGLQSALLWYVEGLAKRSGIAMSFDVQPAEFPRLAPDVERTVFRIIQEALANVYRHSGAQKAWIQVVQKDGEIISTVRDDGRGISEDVLQLRPDSIGVGISGMKQRVKEIGGQIRFIRSETGVTLEAVVPAVYPADAVQASSVTNGVGS